MPRQKRPPIDYRPQFSDTIFRPKEVVEHERADFPATPPAQDADVPATKRATRRDRQIPASERTNARPTDRSNERTSTAFHAPDRSDRPFERTNERTKKRHSFDIYADQLDSLEALQLALKPSLKRKPAIGELVQQALDDFIQKMSKRPFDRSTVRTNDQ